MNVIDQLEEEWEELRRSARAARRLRAWRDEDATLAFDSVDDLVAFVERRDLHPEVIDRVLVALARRAPTDATAARVLLQLLLPGCKALVRRYGHDRRDERGAFIVAEAWTRIRTYPIERRPAKIAANVLGDVRQRLLRSLVEAPEHVSLAAIPEPLLPMVLAEPEAGSEVVEILATAVDRGLIDRDTAHLVALTRLGGASVASVAPRFDASEQTLRRRRLRAERRLRALAAAG